MIRPRLRVFTVLTFPIIASLGATAWNWPLAPPHTIARAFEAPVDRYSAGHRGIDIAASAGSPVTSPGDGEIYFVGVVVNRGVLTIRNLDGALVTVEPIDSALTVGTTVHRGDTLGAVAATGSHCPESCLHLGVRVHGEYVSPLLYLGERRYPILLPTRAAAGSLN